MKPIEFDIWEPVPGEPGKVQRTGQRTAQEVFAELKHRLECTGLLPDKYFLMDAYWRNGREIPEDAGLFCTADYGGNEGKLRRALDSPEARTVDGIKVVASQCPIRALKTTAMPLDSFVPLDDLSERLFGLCDAEYIKLLAVAEYCGARDVNDYPWVVHNLHKYRFEPGTKNDIGRYGLVQAVPEPQQTQYFEMGRM